MSYEYKYPHPAVTVDCVVFTSDNKVLLIQRKNEPCKGHWAFPGGFMNIDKPLPVKGTDDASRAQWFPLDSLPPLAFDHEEILTDAKLIRSDE